jgi:ankyrin repeat protein
MTLHRLPLALFAAATLTLTTPLRAQATDPDPDLRELLRDALYTEEVTRDPEAAAKQYEALLSKHDAQRAFAAAALFRLAEIRRKQDRKDEAIALYQRLLREFPAAEAEAKLARENLAAMGEKFPAAEIVADDEETMEIQRLEKLMATSPDRVLNFSGLVAAVEKNQTRVVRYLLKSGASPTDETAGFLSAAALGHLAIVEAFLEMAADRVSGAMPQALAEAVRKGNIKVTRALLDAGAATDWQPVQCVMPRNANLRDFDWEGTPLITAIANQRLEIVEMLLEKKPDVRQRANGTGISVLHAAAHLEEPAATRLAEQLVVLGADPNALTEPLSLSETASKKVTLSPLQYAVMRGNWSFAKLLISHNADLKQAGLFNPSLEREFDDHLLASIRFLLVNGADANQPRLLAELIDQGPDAIPIIRLLLESGCDPNAAESSGVPPIMRVFSWDLVSLRNGNEKLAKHQKQVELIQLLLKHGADPNTTYGTYTRPATRGPGSVGSPGPFVLESDKSEQLPVSVLMKVVRLRNEQQMNNVSLIQTLLDAGAKPGHEFPEVFDHVARGDEALPIARALLPFRPEILDLDRKGYFLNWNPEVKRLVLDEVLNPAVAAKGGVHLAFAEDGGYQMLVEAGAPIPSTAELLLANVASLTNRSGRFAGQRLEPVLTQVRRDAAGQWTREAIDWNGDAPLPELAVGDIIEMSEKKIPTEKSQDQEFTDQVAWHFRKRISFPVTLEIGGKAREIQLRGDLLVFDPKRDEAPLLSAGHLAGLFLPVFDDSGRALVKSDTLLTIRREGSPDIRMDLSAPGALAFPLQAGDRLILPDPGSVLDPMEWYRVPARLVLQDGGPVRSFGPVADMTFTDKPSLTMPTLIQVLTDTYASRWPLAQGQEASTRFPEFSKRIQAGEIPVILPHPDFSRIRIQRKDEILEINLSAAIQRCGDDTPAAEARQADVPLQPGDVVELPQKPGTREQAWTGFTKEEERFFRKSLDGVLMVRKPDGIIEPVEISYQAPAWQQTPHGMIPSAPASGVSSSRLKALTGMEARGLKLKRDGHELTIDANDAFVRDGDEILAATPVRQPQPRIVPPPPSR